MRGTVRRWVWGMAVAALAVGAGGPAAAEEGGIGGLLLAPTRVVMEPRQRSAELTLMNRGTRPETYRLQLVERRMGEDGGLLVVPDGEPVPSSAAAMVRFSPRQVTLAAGATQKVRLMARRPAGLAPGEYRSHLKVLSLPRIADAPGTRAELADNQLSVELVTTTAVTIPVIVRHGAVACAVSLGDLALADGEAPRLDLRLARSGNRSSYGDLTVRWVPAAGGDPQEVGRLRGLAVYVPNAGRTVAVPLTLAPGQRGQGELRVAYRPAGGGGAPVESTLVLD